MAPLHETPPQTPPTARGLIIIGHPPECDGDNQRIQTREALTSFNFSFTLPTSRPLYFFRDPFLVDGVGLQHVYDGRPGDRHIRVCHQALQPVVENGRKRVMFILELLQDVSRNSQLNTKLKPLVADPPKVVADVSQGQIYTIMLKRGCVRRDEDSYRDSLAS